MPLRRNARGVTTALILLFTMLRGQAHAAANLDIKGLLQRPGVRLVAVEFYATWCKPCMEAVPRWKALHEEYRNAGLRLVVVNTQDPEGRCLNPGWNPDEMICDEEGMLAEQLGVGNSLPAAFLWSWQGGLLVRNGHVDEVARRVEQFLRELPRVVVEVKGGKKSELNKFALTDRLTESGKLTVVSGKAEAKLLKQIRKESHKTGYDDSLACELGKEVPPNSLLKAEVYGKKARKKLALVLHSATEGCAVAAVTVPWNESKPGISVAEGVDKLLARLRGRLIMPGSGAPASREVPEPESETWTATKQYFNDPGPTPYVTAGVGAAVTGVGIWQLVSAQDDRNKVSSANQTSGGLVVGITKEEADELRSSADSKETWGTALTAVGGILMVGGVTWVLMTRSSDDPDEPSADPEVGFAPSVDGFMVWGRF